MIGFILFKPIKFCKSIINFNIIKKDFCLILVFFLIANFFLFSILFYLNGIPLFNSGSRLEIYFGNNFSKIITRLSKFFLDILLILIPLCFFIDVNKYLKYVSVIFAAIVLLFMGSKASILNIVNAFFVVSLFLANNGKFIYLDKIKKKSLKYIVIALSFAFLVISVTESHANTFGFLIYRIIATADSYCMTFPNNTIDIFVSRDNWFINLFASPLRMLGLITLEQVPPVLGTEISSYHSKQQMFTGPNPRHPVLGYIYFKYNFGLLFSFILGIFCGFIRNKVVNYFSFSTFGLIGFAFLYKICFSTETDFYFFLANIINFFGIYLLIYIAFLLLRKASINLKIHS
jgi:hypothetical protein